MTYLQLVNRVLTRLREPTVSAVTQNDYSSLIGALVNDAKDIIEAAHNWTALRDVVTFSTVASTENYSLTGTGDNSRIRYAFDSTTKRYIEPRANEYIDNRQTLTTTPESAPYYYTIKGKDASNDVTVDLFPTPDAAYSVSFYIVKPQAELSDDTDELKVPALPVVHYALALAARERGETGGTSAAEYFAIADNFLADAIAIDSAYHSDEQIWYYV